MLFVPFVAYNQRSHRRDQQITSYREATRVSYESSLAENPVVGRLALGKRVQCNLLFLQSNTVGPDEDDQDTRSKRFCAEPGSGLHAARLPFSRSRS